MFASSPIHWLYLQVGSCSGEICCTPQGLTLSPAVRNSRNGKTRGRMILNLNFPGYSRTCKSCYRTLSMQAPEIAEKWASGSTVFHRSVEIGKRVFLIAQRPANNVLKCQWKGMYLELWATLRMQIFRYYF